METILGSKSSLKRKRRLKSALIVLLSLALLLPFTASAYAANITVELHGKPIAFSSTDGQPVNVNGHVYVPLRKTMEDIGAKVDWHAASQKITITKANTIVTMYINNTEVYILNGINQDGTQYLDAPPFIAEGNRTVVPIRIIAEAFGANVDWDNIRQAVMIKF